MPEGTRGRGKQHAVLTIGRKINQNHHATHVEQVMRNTPGIDIKERLLAQGLNQRTHFWNEIPSPT